MALTTFYTPRWRAVGPTGAPYAGAILKFFEAGTSTPLPVYADVDGNTSLGVTVTADAGGLFAELFMLPQAYKIELYTSANVLVWTADDWFPPAAASAGAVDIIATAGVAFTAGQGGYISDGSNGLNQGQMYLWDADLPYASATPQCYIAVQAIDAGDTGSFRESGRLTGLSGLTPGALYYASATAGALTLTPGLYRRLVGQAVSTTDLLVATNPPKPVTDPGVCEGRLSLTSGLAVPTADVTAASTVYWVPFKGNRVSLYSGSVWLEVLFAELSVAVPGTTASLYDVFAYDNAGTVALELSAAWTSDTARFGSGPYASLLPTQDGVYVKSTDGTVIDATRRYLGTFRTTGVSGQTEDSETKRYLWNYYNRVATELVVIEATNSWTYSTNAWQQANASAANQLEFVVGVNEDAASASVVGVGTNNTNLGAGSVGIGLDSTTAAATKMTHTYTQWDAGTAGYARGFNATWAGYLGVGWHRLVWLERGNGTGTMTWVGDTPAGEVQTGIRATWKR